MVILYHHLNLEEEEDTSVSRIRVTVLNLDGGPVVAIGQ